MKIIIEPKRDSFTTGVPEAITFEILGSGSTVHMETVSFNSEGLARKRHRDFSAEDFRKLVVLANMELPPIKTYSNC